MILGLEWLHNLGQVKALGKEKKKEMKVDMSLPRVESQLKKQIGPTILNQTLPDCMTNVVELELQPSKVRYRKPLFGLLSFADILYRDV